LGGATAPVTTPATKAVPDWSHLHEELRRKGVTMQLLWQEYRQAELLCFYRQNPKPEMGWI